MTAQSPEVLILDGSSARMVCLPLQAHIDRLGIDPVSLSSGRHTGLLRGYTGVWEVMRGHLYLIGLYDHRGEPFTDLELALRISLPARASWFSGRLEVDQGERLTYWHFGWGSQFARRLRLYVDAGNVVKRRCYDQERLLRRRFEPDRADYEDFRRRIVVDGHLPPEPVGGFTEAGLRSLGLVPLPGECWPAVDAGDDLVNEWSADLLARCRRPPIP